MTDVVAGTPPPLIPKDRIRGIPWDYGIVANNGDLIQASKMHEEALELAIAEGGNKKQHYIDTENYWNQTWFEYDDKTPRNTAVFNYTNHCDLACAKSCGVLIVKFNPATF